MHDRHGNVVPQPREVVRDVSSFDKLRWSEPHSNIALPREVRDGEQMQAPAHLTHSAADVNRLSARAQDTKAGALSGDVRPEPISRFFERWAPARRKGITPSAVKHQEEICAWHVPVVPTETVTVDRSDDRRVDPLVPVGSDFRFPEGSVLLAHQVVAVDLEIFEQLEIDGWPARGEAHAVARSRARPLSSRNT